MRPRQSRRTFIAILSSIVLGRANVAYAQPAAPVIGILSTRGAQDSGALINAFKQGLSAELGGKNYSIEDRWADGDYDRLPALAADSDEAARVYRAYSAHRSNLMPPTNPI
jgi:putative ABC transport system substrate-binding protein